jgi:hypothetical protein
MTKNQKNHSTWERSLLMEKKVTMTMESESDKVGFDIFVLRFFGSFRSLALWLCEILAGEQRDSVREVLAASRSVTFLVEISK